MKKLLLLFLISLTLFAKMEFSDPQPTFEEPRKWLIRLYKNDLETVNHDLDAINNVLKEYPTESLKITVVVYSKGMRVLKKNYDKKTLGRIRAVMDYGVEFVGCKNTMETMGWKEKDFIDNITFVQAGIAQAIELSVAGWVDVTPY